LAHVHGVTPGTSCSGNRETPTYQALLTTGTVVALFFDNCPEIYFLQIALLKLAAIPCYINSNLRSTSLIHCANISGAKLLFTEDALFDFVLAITGDLDAGVKVYNWGSRSDSLVETMTEKTFDSYDGSVTLGAEARKQLKMNSTGAIIYTSGTTVIFPLILFKISPSSLQLVPFQLQGLPKAAYMSMQKIGGAGYSSGNNYDANDRYYQCLPLFHSSGQIGVIIAWYQKTTLIVSRKFSATKFFIECAATNATCFQYIGELCRYLLAPPPNPKVDRGHKVVKCLGNGLRPDVWMEVGAAYAVCDVFSHPARGCRTCDSLRIGSEFTGLSSFTELREFSSESGVNDCLTSHRAPQSVTQTSQ
jgi:acyl-CoA synthetase (AMP-forming)/AMP-acid ligase II